MERINIGHTAVIKIQTGTVSESNPTPVYETLKFSNIDQKAKDDAIMAFASSVKSLIDPNLKVKIQRRDTFLIRM